MFVVRGTKKFRDRVRGESRSAVTDGKTLLGDWYATVLFWKPQVALFIDERTLLPVLQPFAPASSVIRRFPRALEQVLRAHSLPDDFVTSEIAEMGEYRIEPTTNRSTVGIMNEFSALAAAYGEPEDAVGMVALSLRLAATPCGPLYGRHGSPDRELAALVGSKRQRT